MAIYQGTYYAQQFVVTDATTGLAVNIAGYTFSADFRVHATDANPPLLALTSAGGGFSITDASNGKFQILMTSVQTLALPVGILVFDVLRTDPVAGSVFLFGGNVTVKQPVTR